MSEEFIEQRYNRDARLIARGKWEAVSESRRSSLFVGATGWCAAPAQFACSRYAAVVVPAGVRGGRFLIGVRLQHGCSMERDRRRR